MVSKSLERANLDFKLQIPTAWGLIWVSISYPIPFQVTNSTLRWLSEKLGTDRGLKIKKDIFK